MGKFNYSFVMELSVDRVFRLHVQLWSVDCQDEPRQESFTKSSGGGDSFALRGSCSAATLFGFAHQSDSDHSLLVDPLSQCAPRTTVSQQTKGVETQ